MVWTVTNSIAYPIGRNAFTNATPEIQSKFIYDHLKIQSKNSKLGFSHRNSLSEQFLYAQSSSSDLSAQSNSKSQRQRPGIHLWEKMKTFQDYKKQFSKKIWYRNINKSLKIEQRRQQYANFQGV